MSRPPASRPQIGAPVLAEIAWERRHRHMRMHTALHLLCSLVPYPVTGGSIGAEESRLDFDITDAGAVDKDELTERLMALVAADHPVTTRWISDEELADNPGLVRTMSVKPPTGTGRVRLVSIGVDGAIDLQPCGGTHVRSTAEIGPVAITKIEKKGRQNRRIRLAFDGPAMSELLVSAEWLKATARRSEGEDRRRLLVSASTQNRDAKAEYRGGHIPGAVFFDIDHIADRTTDLPHMLPDGSRVR